MSSQRNQFIYRQSIQLNFPIRLRSFLLHFLEKHIQEALKNVLVHHHQRFHFHLILKSHFSDQQQLISLDINPKNLDSEELLKLIERNIFHLNLSSPVSNFDILVTSQKMNWKSKSHAQMKTKRMWPPDQLTQAAIA